MTKSRLEAFSDGVIAIIITIMVLELKVPHGSELKDLTPLFPVFLSYLLSFINLGIYWNNHHHLLHMAKHVNGATLWANLHLLFWLSMIPFATSWMGENHFAKWPVAVYGFVLLMAGVAYFILVNTLTAIHGGNESLAEALGSDLKGKMSVLIYLLAIILTFVNPVAGLCLIAFVAAMWLIPDRRIEKRIAKPEKNDLG
jgi:uncharacterized membrane protein